MWDIPMSASLTCTVLPASPDGAEHVSEEEWYPDPPPIIPDP
jgi:hypothetical protein